MAQKGNIVGVILAAGKGTRMLPFSTKYPKPLLPICNRPLIHYQIESMKQLGIKDIIIVVGHLGFEISKVMGDGSSFGVRIRYIEQHQTLGIAHAVGQLEPHVSSPFLLFLGDIFFISNNLHEMIKHFENDKVASVLAVKEENNEQAIKKNFCVILDEENFVKRVIEKPSYLRNNLKGCGIYLFSEVIFDSIRRTPRTALRDEYEITEAIQIMIKDGFPIKALTVIEKDVNLTNPFDLLSCNMELIRSSGAKNVIGKTVQINSNVKIQNSVIGDYVTIHKPITMKNTVVFAHSEIKSGKNLNTMIITPDCIIDCKHFADDK